MFKNYIKIAWRNLVSQKLFTSINIGGLSVAMAVAVLIMMWVQNELSFDSYHPHANRIYLVKNHQQVSRGDTRIVENSPFLLKKALEHELPETEQATHALRTQENELTLRVNGASFNEEWGIYVDENWFKIFQYEFINGSPEAFFTYPSSLIITKSKAQKLFGEMDVTGRSLLIDSTAYTIQGVVEDNPINSSFDFDVLMPMDAKLKTSEQRAEVVNWRYLTCKTFIKLRPKADIEKVADKITQIFSANRTQNNIQATLLPLKYLRFDTDFEWSAFKHVDIRTVQIFSILAILLLLIASINYINLSVARAGLRSAEVSIRKIVGADHRQLFFQMTSESILAAILALLLSMLLIWEFLPFFNSFTGMDFRFNLSEPHLLIILFGTLLSIILLTGIYPALLLSSFSPTSIFKGNSVFQQKTSVLQKGLIVSQFTFAVVMIIAAMTVSRQLSFIQQQDAGYNRSQVFTIKIPQEAYAPVVEYFQATEGKGENWPDILRPVKQELLAQSSIKHVVRMGNNSVVDWTHVTSGNIDWEGREPGHNPVHTPFIVDADLKKIMNLKLVKGCWFAKSRPSDRQNIVLNEKAVSEFGLKEPVIGRRFNEGKIIGVVKDFYYKSLHEKIGPVVIHTDLPPFASVLMLEIQPGQIKEALQYAENVWYSHFPGEPFSYTFLDDEFNQLYSEDQKALSFIKLFSGISIMISCLGLLGMVVFAARRRTKEIGIRKVLGASVANITGLLSKDFLKLVTLGFVIAVPVAWYAMNKWLADFAYKIAIGPGIFLLAGALALLIALSAVSWQSIRAALANPVDSLRSE